VYGNRNGFQNNVKWKILVEVFQLNLRNANITMCSSENFKFDNLETVGNSSNTKIAFDAPFVSLKKNLKTDVVIICKKKFFFHRN
jgi:hypothetical protein